MVNKISVIIITGSEEENIRDCLKSVKWADEIIVVDSESADKTIEIAKEFTNKIFVHKWEGYARQKLFAMEKSENEWVLSLDADERVKPNLVDEILTKDLSGVDGYYIRRENYFMGKLIAGCGWGNDYQLRLFKKSKTKLTDHLVHEGFIVEGKTEKLKNEIIHFSYKDLNQALQKVNKYSTLEAIEKAGRKKVYITAIIFKPFLELIKYFIGRKGYKDGIYGFLISLMHALTVFQVQVKIWELKQKNNEQGE